MTVEQALTMQEDQSDADLKPARSPAVLTTGEIKVLRLVASGMTNVQEAGELFISRCTVDAHLRCIYRKLGVESRTAVSRCAIEHKLV